MTEQPTRKQPAWLPFAVVGGAVVIAMILWAVLSAPAKVPTPEPKPRETFTLTGRIAVPNRVETFVPDGGCIARSGYDDIGSGTGVTVYDASGKVLAVGALGNGQKRDFRCAYNLIVHGVPRGEGFYQVEVASRGKVAFDESTLVSTGASLTLG
jgi:hypothetical protein